MRGLCISFPSSYLFPVSGGRGAKNFRTGGGGLPIWGVTLAVGGGGPVTHYMPC